MRHWDGHGSTYKPSTAPVCAHCLVSKAHSLPVKKLSYNFQDTSTPLANVYADTSTDMGTSLEGYNHYCMIFDATSAKPFVYNLTTKSESHQWLMHWMRFAHNQQAPFKIGHLHLDKGEL